MTVVRRVTIERAKDLLEYDGLSGLFKWKSARGGMAAGKIAGSFDSYGYVQIKIDGTLYLAHRLAWLFVTGEWPVTHLDHKNGDKQDNRIENLRYATVRENSQNRKKNAKNKSGYVGVSWNRNSRKWIAQIGKDGRRYHLGCFDDPEEAYSAYVAAKAELHTFNPEQRA